MISRNLTGTGLPPLAAQAIAGTVNDGLTAAGTTQATALLISGDLNVFSTVASGAGCILPVGGENDTYSIINDGANALLIYPPVGGTINGGAVNASASLAAGSAIQINFQSSLVSRVISSALALAAPTGSALIGFLQAGSGAVATTVQSKLRENISVIDFGAIGNGTTNDTAAFNAAHVAAQALNKSVYVPGSAAGYLIAGTITALAPMFGDGSTTTLITSSATADVIQCGVAQVTFSDFSITSSVTRSAGYYISFNGAANANNYCRVERVLLSNWFYGIGLLGGGSTGFRMLDTFMATNVAGGIGFIESTTANAVDVVLRDVLILGPTSGAQTVAGIQIQNTGDVTLCRVSTVKTGIGLSFIPQSGQRIQAAIISDSYFDSGSGAGIQVNPAAGATIDLIKVSNTWACTNANGVSLAPSGTGLTKRIELSNVNASNNTGQGILAQPGGTVSNMQIIGGSFSANTNGIYIGALTEKVVICGVTAGPSGEFAGNSSSGIVIEATADNFSIIGNIVTGNSGSSINNAAGLSATKVFKGNVGYVSENNGVATGSTDASGDITITHGCATTPTKIFVQVTGVPAVIAHGVHTIGSTTFKARLFNVAAAGAPLASFAYGSICWNASV